MTPSKLESVLTVVSREVTQLSFRWKIYCQLFDSGALNLAILNDSGSEVFALLQRLILDDVMSSLSRLTDSGRDRKNENASIRNVVEKARTRLSATTVVEIDALIQELDKHVMNTRTYRHKALAHNDLEHALGIATLPTVTYDELKNGMKTLQEIINKLQLELHDLTIDYDVIIQGGTGGDSLLEILKRGHCIEE